MALCTGNMRLAFASKIYFVTSMLSSLSRFIPSSKTSRRELYRQQVCTHSRAVPNDGRWDLSRQIYECAGSTMKSEPAGVLPLAQRSASHHAYARAFVCGLTTRGFKCLP